MNQVIKLFNLLDNKARIQCAFLVVIMIIGSILEAFSISVVTLFIGIVSDSINGSVISSLPWLKAIHNLSGISDQKTFLAHFGIGLLVLFILKNLYLLFQVYSQNKFVYTQQARISVKLLNSYMSSTYSFHLRRNTAELLRNITTSIDAIFGNGFNPVISIISESFIILAISILLISVEPMVTVSALITVGGLVSIFLLVVRKRMGYFGQRVQVLSKDIILWTNQSIQGIKEIKVAGREPFFSKVFSEHRFNYARYLALSSTIQKIPRLYLEVIIVGGILLILAILIQRGDSAGKLIPLVGLFAMASIRLMPSLNLIASSLNSLKFGTAAINDIYSDVVSLMENPVTPVNVLNKKTPDLSEEIRLEKLTYVYPGANGRVIEDLDLVIKKGQSVAFVGGSGAGKTTVIDIILGLLRPVSGKVLVDGEDIYSDGSVLAAWQRSVGYIPQEIYLIDDTLRRNIAFGIDDGMIDEKKIMSAVARARLEEFIKELPEGLDTKIGERGVRMSGGQCQRIGIARALYHDPAVIVMDEATSSLDNRTESEISEAIDEMSGVKTVIIIAHRLTTVKNCDTLFFLEGGRLADIGAYSELIRRNEAFRSMAMHSETE